jgi:hypothetical protein
MSIKAKLRKCWRVICKSMRRADVPNWLTCAGTFCLAWFAYSQFVATNSTSKQQLRAYVNVSVPVLEHLDDPGQDVLAILAFQNFGLTPANDVQISLNGFLEDESPKADFKIAAPKDMSTQVLAPSIILQRSFNFHKLNSGIVKLIHDGERPLYVFGLITYKDIFGTQHQTKYRFICKGTPNTNKEFFKADSNGNEAD